MKQQRLIFAGAAIIIGVAGFLGGMECQKHASTSTATAAGRTGQRGGFGGGFSRSGSRPTFGTISTISGSTLTITDARDTTATTTVTFTSATTITDSSGATVAASTLATGDTILVRGTTLGTTVAATSIQINPSFGGMGGAGAGSNSNSGSNVN